MFKEIDVKSYNLPPESSGNVTTLLTLMSVVVCWSVSR